MTLNISATAAAAIHDIATRIIALAEKNITVKGSFSFVLTGGNTARKLYELLAAAFSEAIDWHKVFFFIGDERFVPLTDADSNYRMAATTLLQPLQIREDHIFFVDTSLAMDKAATLYQQQIEQFFNDQPLSFDLVLLGMGDNLHVASMFPYDPVLQDTTPGVKAVKTNDKNAYRITMNAPLINNAKTIYFLILGEDKARAVQQALQGPEDTEAFPVQLIRKQDAHWFMDKAAATYL